MFQVLVVSQNKRFVKMSNATLPAKGTDPPDPSEIKLTDDDILRNLFTIFKADIQREITAKGGEWTLGRLGFWPAQKNGYAERVKTAALGKDTKLTPILQALGFRLEGAGTGAKVRNP